MESGKQRGAAGCALCAAALGLATCPAESAAPESDTGSVATASLQIRVSVAQGGALQGLRTIGDLAALSTSDPLCLWLNTGTRGYTLAAQAQGEATHLFTWATRDRSVELNAEPSDTLTAAARPRCSAWEQAQLSARRVSQQEGGGPVTIMVSPE